ncbi:CHAP domain-containing protein [[Mycobacterium] zoologicum]|uniref:CHAP domain-containing protein n=1 Tax=[Mycobacterium] zoologicum TaxID=2872311 RepID=UPI001CDB274B|nr:CHAP domain-containing protein [Mycolicibacter sp. MYC101]MEB3064493.1 CHAP domain-containing protein [Mycolicibacter sp. MYC101]
MMLKVAGWVAALVAVLLTWPGGNVPASAAPPIDPTPLAARIADQVDGFRQEAADAALGNPVVYGDGQCYPLIAHYISGLGYPWQNHDPSGNAFDLYHHFATNGLAQYFDQIPFAGGANEPLVGDVVVYGPGGFVSEHGHAAVVTAIERTATAFRYETADQNSSGRLFVTVNWRDFDPAYNTLGYLRPKV